MLRALAPVQSRLHSGCGPRTAARSASSRSATLRRPGVSARSHSARSTAITPRASRGLIVGVPVRRWQAPWGALVVRVRTRDAAEAVLEEAAAAMSPIVERDFLLQRGAGREQTLVKASERRLSRLGFDLHDGALQHIAALGADLRRLRPQLARGRLRRIRLDRRVASASSIGCCASSRIRSSPQACCAGRSSESSRPKRRGSRSARVSRCGDALVGDFGAMTQSQKIALIRSCRRRSRTFASTATRRPSSWF